MRKRHATAIVGEGDRYRRKRGLLERRGTPIRYRYRTAALVGLWRDSREAALRDALAACQARADAGAADGVQWLVDGEIEALPVQGTGAEWRAAEQRRQGG